MRRAIFGLLVAACGSDPAVCVGVGGDAGVGAATLTAGSDSFGYSGFRWGENNDCPAAGASVISVTIRGSQTQPAPAEGFGLGVCLPRPDLIGAGAVDLGDATKVQLVGASASGGACTTMMTAGAKPTGTVTFIGFCTGAGSAFEMAFAGQVAGTQTCGSGPTTQVTLVLGGRARVEAQ